ncbi:hypothetical protein TNCV_2126021 [Trichonephila clavipes]|nr:hypothetical protein TNCV_2126021 [Trichonephila clavipes]
MQAFERHIHFREGRESVADDKHSRPPQTSRPAEHIEKLSAAKNTMLRNSNSPQDSEQQLRSPKDFCPVASLLTTISHHQTYSKLELKYLEM